MKIVCSGLMLFLFVTLASAQALLTPPDVTILQNKWRFEVRDRALEVDPFKANRDRQQEESRQKSTAQVNENRIRMGEPTVAPTITQSSPGARGISAVYIYELKVKNTGQKEIRFITWEYIFFEPGTTHELGRKRFGSRGRIRSGTTRNVVARSSSSPTGTVDAKKASKAPHDQYSEQVIIRRIEYADGSVWRAASR